MGARPIFIVGAMRSGTTLMRLMINRHSQIAIPPESHFVARLFRRFDPAALLMGGELEEAIAIVTSNAEWQRDWHGDPHSLRARVEGRTLSVGEFIDAVFALQIEPSAKPRWADKTPGYLFQVSRLRVSFPDARFVAMVRDPRDAYISLAPRDWVGQSTWQVGSYLLRCDRLVRGFLRDDHDDFCAVRYEDLVVATESTLRRVCAFLEIDYEPSMCEFYVDAAEHVQPWELDSGVHEKLLRPVDANDIGRWRREGSRSDMRGVEAVTYEAVNDFGYETTLRRFQVPVVAAVARARHHLRHPRRSAAALRARVSPSRVADRS